MAGTRADARKRREDRTTWGSEHEDVDVLQAELAACREEIDRLRDEVRRLQRKGES